jgi:glycosyltransferase involved in cell wall biosynthesis
MLISLFRQADAVGFCSDALRKQAASFLSVAGREGIVLGDGIIMADIEKSEPYLPKHPYIFTAGRLVPKKGGDMLIQAFSRIAPRYADIQLCIAGDGPERPNLENLIKNLHMEKRIKLLGTLSHKEIAQYLKGCLFFTLPSRMEAFGIVNLEAMAASKAVVATRVGGVPNVVQDGETGILVEPNVEALANGIVTMLENPSRRAQMGQKGYQIVQQRFRWENVAKGYLTVFEQAIAKHIEKGNTS